MARRRATAPVVEEVDELEELEEPTEDDGEELEELVEEEPEPAPKTRRRTTKAASVAKAVPAKAAAASTSDGYDSNWLAEYVTEETGQQYDSRAIRMLLRKLAANGALAREVGTDRSRYTFKGPNDAIVRQVVKMVKTGEASAVKQEGLQAAKAAGAAKKTAPAKAAPVRKAAPAKAAPAKATTTRRRTRTAE